MFKKMTIRWQLRILLMVTAVVIAAVQVLYTVNYIEATKRQTYAYFDDIAEQVSFDIRWNLNQIRSSAKMLSFSGNMQLFLFSSSYSARQLNFNAAKDSMDFCIAGNHGIDSIRFKLFDNDRSVFAGNYQRTRLLDQIQEEYHLDDIPDDFTPFFTRVFEDSYTGAYFYAYVSPVYCVLPGYDPTQAMGVQIALASSGIYEGINLMHNFAGMELFIADEHFVVASSRTNTQQDTMRLLREQGVTNVGEYEVNTEAGVQWVKLQDIPDTPFRLYITVPRSELLREVKDVTRTAILFSVPALTLLLLLGITLSRSIASPIGRLVRDMKCVGSSGGPLRVEKSTENELGSIACEINDMLDKLDAMNENVLASRQQVFDSEIERVKAELAYYCSQINSHFLYNSVDCIRSMALDYGHPDIAAMAVSLSRILRYSIKEESFVTLMDELGILCDYFTVINARYMGVFELSVQVPDELNSCRMIKMVLQPIIENCFSHAFPHARKGGRIEVAAESDFEMLTIRVSDDGAGIAPDDLELVNKSLAEWRQEGRSGGNIGLANIQRRVKMTYGEAYGISVQSVPGGGTLVKVTLPDSRVGMLFKKITGA